MEAIKFFGVIAASGVIGNCVGNLASRVVTNKYPLSGAAIAGGVFGVTGFFAFATSEYVKHNAGDRAEIIYLIAVGIFGAAALSPHIVKPLTDYSMSYYESGAYAAISTVAFFIYVCSKG
ncbi:MAG: hypothetical protein H7A41_04385 [Chlamydiales bacterium]|nr:hypothetical protein [Chlamydiales bacterium]